jgi:hypothetical protein
MSQIKKRGVKWFKDAGIHSQKEMDMKYELMTLPEIARYLGVSPSRLVRAYCNRGTLDGVPLPEPLNHVSFSRRYWSREEVRQFRHTLQRARQHA